MQNGEWITVHVMQSSTKEYDFFAFHKTTEMQRRIQSYEERLMQAEEANQSKTTFLSRMSHEIRTLAESKLEKDNPAMQYLEKVDELSDHLLSLINDILDMSRIEAGRVELESKPLKSCLPRRRSFWSLKRRARCLAPKKKGAFCFLSHRYGAFWSTSSRRTRIQASKRALSCTTLAFCTCGLPARKKHSLRIKSIFNLIKVDGRAKKPLPSAFVILRKFR